MAIDVYPPPTETVTGTVTANAGTNLNTSAVATEATLDARSGSLTEGAPASDTASSGLNGRLQRIAQRITSLIALIPAALTSGGGMKVGVVDALPAGTNNIGDIDVLTVPADPFGVNADAVVAAGAAGSIQAKLRRATQGLEDLKSLIVLAAGTNNIGDVDVLTVPADPFGANADAAVAAGAAGSIQAKLRRVTQGLEDLKTLIVLGAGTNAIGKLAANSGVDIGDVDVTSLPALPAGTNNIGDVDLLSAPWASTLDGVSATQSILIGILGAGGQRYIVSADGLGDNNPVAGTYMLPVMNYVLNASGYPDRIRGDITNGVDVDVTRMAALVAGSAIIGKVGIDQTTPGTTDHVTNTAVATEVHLGQVGGNTINVRVEKTRVADTSVYAANDAIDVSTTVPTGFVFAVGRTATGSGTVISAHIATDQTTNVSAYDLDLYDAAPAAYPNDNAEALRGYTNAAKFLGTISFPAVAKKTANSTQAESVPTTAPSIPFVCVGSSSIYGVLRTVTGFTPASGQKFYIKLGVTRN